MEIKFQKYRQENIRNQNFNYMFTSGSFHSFEIKSDHNVFSLLINGEIVYVERLQHLKPVYDKKRNEIKVYSQQSQLDQSVHTFTIRNENIKKLENLLESLKSQISYYKFKGPLSFEPSCQNRSSPLSSESPNQNYRGFFNLFIIIFIAANIRIIFENYMKYGILINFINPFTYLEAQGGTETLFVFLSLGLYIVIGYIIQKVQIYKRYPERFVVLLNIINISSIILVPYFFVTIYKPHPGLGIILLTNSVILASKMISYVHVLRNMRMISDKIKKMTKNQNYLDVVGENEISSGNYEYIKKYEKNIEQLIQFKDLVYFIAAPTLCFQFNYPRTNKIRKIWLIKRFAELIISLVILTLLIFQYIEPLVQNFQRDNNSFIYKCERMLRLALPNTYCWITFFFIFFQIFLNILSELLYFADRHFYTDWWNCKNLGDYWRQWNLPVHFFMLRHIYNPLLKLGVSKSLSMFIVFFISAFFHEYLISASIGVWSFWAFLAMMIQMPIIIIQNSLKNLILKESQLGNIMFWISFCVIGQPTCLFVYYQLYMDNKI